MKSLAELKSRIHADPGLRGLLEWTEETVRASGGKDPAHDFAHLFRVALWTIRLGATEDKKLDEREAVAAALLHDIVNLPKDSPDRKNASFLSAKKAAEILPRFNFSPEAIERVGEAIRCHSFSRGEEPRTPLAKALQDADRLEALGSIGIMRCISIGAQMGADFFHPQDPFASSRALDDRRYSVDHFFTKLLRLPATMTTESGRFEAERRARIMREFLARLSDELGIGEVL